MCDWSDIGAELRGEREARAWSLRDVSHQTRIPVPTLQQLENNDYREFPSPAYAKSFLTQYSAYLEVDVTDWLEEFETGNVLANLGSYEYLKHHDEHVGAPPAPSTPRPTNKRPLPAPDPSVPALDHATNPLQPLVVFLVTALLLTLGAFGYRHISEQAIANSPPVPPPAPLKEVPGTAHSRPAPLPPAPSPVQTPSLAEAKIQPTPSIAVAMPIHGDGQAILNFDAPPPRAVIIEE